MTKQRASILGALVCAALLLGALPLAAADAASGPGSAVVLVSGFNTVTPFSTSDPACAGKEGPDWNPATGVASALKSAKFTVFTAPVKHASGSPAAACAPGTPVPPVATTYINSNGDLTANGQALGKFLAFLRDNYGVTRVDLVGHSDGGLWSRSAITQRSNYPGVIVTSLTTLGTPHTGSFVADLAEDLNNGRCHARNPIAQAACVALQDTVNLVVKDLGEATVEELSSDYLTTWNPEQEIGACPVTGIAGTYFHIPLPADLFPAYYNPSDGLVGEASALGRASKSIYGTPIPAPRIPNFQNGGEFPVVHGPIFAFLSKTNLINQASISNAVVSTLNSQPAGAAPCTTAAPLELTDGSVRITVPSHQFLAPVHGVLPRPRRGDRILSRPRARLICRGRRLRSTPFLGNPKLRATLPRCRARLRVRGRGSVLLVRARGRAFIRIQGTKVTVRPRGVRARRVVLQLEVGKRFQRIPLNRSGRGALPAGAGPTTLRVTLTTRKRQRLVGSATVSR